MSRKVGTIAWRDLTVENAEALKDFYVEVVGFEASPQDMGGYDDYNMVAPGSGEAIAGICHARGPNANLPPQWLVYFAVDDVDAAAARCIAQGGAVIDGPRQMGSYRFCVIRDPAGAVAALISE
jgi:predicted enzyme related to lactoylglutathione lyase